MADIPDPAEYDDFEEWFADAMAQPELNEETIGEIVEKVGQSQWVK